MIAKKIKRSNGKQSKLVNVRNLIEYINAPTTKNAEEKLLFAGTRGFVFDDLEIQKKEMLALVHCNVRSPNPVMHYLLSWKEGEQPTREQCEEVIDIFIEETGLTNNQIMWGVHNNTKNIHMHIAANKIDLDTEKITRINNNLDLEILHKVIAKIEHKQGWESTPNSRYTCDDEGNILRANSKKILEPIALRALAVETYYGDKSAIRIAQEKAFAVMKESQSWDELHQKLDDVGMVYQKKGSGAVIKVKDTFIKASSVSRDFSLKQMEKRLGEFEESAYLLPDLRGLVKTVNFFTIPHVHEQSPHQIRHSPLSLKEKAEKQETMQELPQLKPFPMPTCPMLARGKKIPYKLFPRQLKKRKKKKHPALLPSFLRACGGVDNFMHIDCPEYGGSRLNKEHIKLWFQYQDASFKKKQERIVHEVQFSLGIVTEKKSFAVPKFTEWLKENHPKSLDSWRYEREQNYIKNEDTKEMCVMPFFEDVEKKLAELAQTRWKKISVYGNDFFKQLIMKLSLKYRLKITNQELQEHVAKLQETYKSIDSTEQLQDFLAYHNALQADRYRVTCEKFGDTKDVLSFDKLHHVDGFTTEQIQERIKDLLQLQGESYNIFLTPFSENKHYILIDGMKRAKLEELLLDGYKPSMILERSSDNYQAVISIPKLGATHDDAVGDSVAKRLQLLYGGENSNQNKDTRPSLHAMPAFQTHESKHVDDTRSTVKLVQAEQIECSRAHTLAQQINLQYEAKRKNNLGSQKAYSIDYNRANTLHTAYFKHLEEIRAYHKNLDNSRIDAMIATRMRATGHNQEDVENTVKECAPKWQGASERKSWEDYARRTADYAFSYSGTRDILKNKNLPSMERQAQGTSNMHEDLRRQKVS